MWKCDDGRLYGISYGRFSKVDTKGISEFRGVEHRIEYVDTLKDVRIYNDSKATNTHAACAALSAFDHNVIYYVAEKINISLLKI